MRLLAQFYALTAIAALEQMLSCPGRVPGWGARVMVLKAYSGGSLRVLRIRQQIRQMLMQLPTVREVRIAIEGQTAGVLEP